MRKEFICLVAISSLLSGFAFADHQLGDAGVPASLPPYAARGLDLAAAPLPSHLDLRDKGIVAAARNQGACGSCWAFSLVGVLESRARVLGDGTDFSEQQLLSSGLGSCLGGSSGAATWWASHGPLDRACAVYTANDTPPPARCMEHGMRLTPDSHKLVDMSLVKQSLVEHGPAYFRFDVYQDFETFWGRASSGAVYRAKRAANKFLGGHAVLLIGWDDGKNAWLARNSWGAAEGPNSDGSFWIAMDGHELDLNIAVTTFDMIPLRTAPLRMIGDGAGVIVGDINGDGKADLVGIGAPGAFDAGVVYVGLSNGSGFPGWTWKTTGRTIGSGAKVLLGDVNHDGKDDLIGIGAPTDPDAGRVYVALSNGSGFPEWTWRSTTRMIGDGARVRIGDVTGDGKADLVGIGAPGGADAGVVYVAASDGSGFPGWTWHSAGRVIGDGATVLLGDITGDGKADLVGVGAPRGLDAGVVYVAASDGSGFPRWTWHSAGRMIGDGATVLLGDISGDGKPDLVGIGAPGGLDAGVIYLALSDGTGFSPWAWTSTTRRFGDGSRAILGDVNGDRKFDLVGVGAPGSSDAGVVYMAPSTGSGFSGWTWESGR